MALNPVPLKNPVLLKLLLVGLFTLIMLIPIHKVDNLVYERQMRHDSVIDEISQKWGRAQSLIGPVLTIPYYVDWKDDKGKTHHELHKAYFLPDKLTIKGRIHSEKRYRGIFETIVYNLDLQIEGQFSHPDLAFWNIAPENSALGEAILSMGVSDTRGIRDILYLQWDQQPLEFSAGSGNNGLFDSGLHTRLPLSMPSEIRSHTFSLTLSLHGSHQLNFVPVAKSNQVELESDWPDPSFIGEYLPVVYENHPQGFKAQWEVSHLGRSHPQTWTTQNPPPLSLQQFSFGTDLLLMIDFYHKTERALKYAILFIFLTLTTFFLIEILNPLRIHPLQYLMVAAGLCLFYLLLLSFSEHIQFYLAYLIASISTILLIATYTAKITHARSRGLLIAAVLTGLYSYLYVLLHLQDYSLLFGSLGLFLTLATIMYVTRNVDWYQLQLAKDPVVKEPIA